MGHCSRAFPRRESRIGPVECPESFTAGPRLAPPNLEPVDARADPRPLSPSTSEDTRRSPPSRAPASRIGTTKLRSSSDTETSPSRFPERGARDDDSHPTIRTADSGSEAARQSRCARQRGLPAAPADRAAAHGPESESAAPPSVANGSIRSHSPSDTIHGATAIGPRSARRRMPTASSSGSWSLHSDSSSRPAASSDTCRQTPFGEIATCSTLKTRPNHAAQTLGFNGGPYSPPDQTTSQTR